MHSLTIDGQTMRYLDVGQGEVIVLGHSYLWDGQMWQAQIEVLSQYYRCIVPDFWGHGQSDAHPPSMKNLTHYAEHILILMDHLCIGDFSIAGLSVGGMWAAELTLLAPQRVKALVLLNTFIGLEPEVNCLKYSKMFEIVEQEKGFPEPLVDQIVPLFFAKKSVEANERYVAQFKSQLMATMQVQAVDYITVGKMIFGRRELFDEIENLALPVLIIAGVQDQCRTPLESYLMNDSITGSELHVLSNAGHISTVESPLEVTELLSSFFAKHL
jgi:pimeloyl-ACP methyl ester carboxylesterase